MQSSLLKWYTETMDTNTTTWTTVPHHVHTLRSTCGTKFIDKDSRGWKLYTPKLGAWTYFNTLEAAKKAA